MAISFLLDNIKTIDFGKAAVIGEDGSLISSHVIIALHELFANRGDHMMNVKVTTDEFKTVLLPKL